MSYSDRLLLLAILIPTVGTLFIVFSREWKNLRELVSLTTAGLLFWTVIRLTKEFMGGAQPTLTLAKPLEHLSISLHAEPLGLLFALVASGLWILTAIYAIGYMRGNNEKNQTRFFACFSLSIAAAIGLALSANMFTLFIFYEVLTLSTYPLVTHKGDDKARAGGRVYLGILLTTSVGFLLPAMIWTFFLAGTLDFTPGGILNGHISGVLVLPLLALYMFGIGKAALMPFHRWLPAAMVAPTPVSALLHAVAVVKAGVFTVLKVSVYIFGTDLLKSSGATTTIMWVAAFTILMASIVALTKDNLKARLAYSTVSQLAYIVLGAMLATSMGIIGGAFQIAMHAMGKITLFFCAGAIYTATHKTEISTMDGLGRKMPLTYAAFCLGAFSIIGLPPFGGAWSKWYLMMGSVDAGHLVMIAVLLISSLLNIAYLLPIVARGFFLRPNGQMETDDPTGEPLGWEIREAPILCVAPLCVTAIGTFVLFFYANALFEFLQPIIE